MSTTRVSRHDETASRVPATAEVSFLCDKRTVHECDLRVLEIDPEADPRWDAFVAAHPDGLIYHCASYLRTLAQEYGNRSLFLACVAPGGQLRGILPLFYTRGFPLQKRGLFGRRLTSLPRTPVAGPLALDRGALVALLRAAKERVREEKHTVLQLKMTAPIEDGVADGLAYIPWRMTYVLHLPDTPEALRFGNSRNHTRIKQRVIKAAKMGVEVRPAETETELEGWYDLYLETMRWHAVPPRPYRLFRGLWNHLGPDKMRLVLARQKTGDGSKLLAGSIFLMHGSTVFYAFNGRRGDELSKLPNYAILWKAISDACREGFRYFDLGEVTGENAGLAEFKGKWTGKPKPLHRYYYPARHEEVSDKTDSKGAAAYPLVEAVWRRLPLRITALVGNLVYGFL
jgi:CelD/BcsL family acetyltransferase involved in cellulose biosynthesis